MVDAAQVPSQRAEADGVTLRSIAQGVVRGYVLAMADRSLVGDRTNNVEVFGTAEAAHDFGAGAIERGRVVVLELREVEAR